MSMITKLLKDWTLPAAMLAGTVSYLVFAFVPFLEKAALFFDPIFDTILPLFMFLILFVTFCKVDFRRLRPVGWHLWVGIFQVLLVALLTAIALCLPLSNNELILLESLLCCVIGPCAAAAAVITQKLGGSLEEMTTYTFLSNFITAMLIPVCFPLIDSAAHIGFWAAFAKILYEVCVVLLVPMLLAWIVKHRMKKLHRRIVSIKDLSYYLWACSLMIVTGTTVKHIVHADTTVLFLLCIAGMSLLVCIAQYGVGRFIGRHFNRTMEAGQALGQKNTAFAIWIAYSYLTPLASVGPGCYILWQNIINSIEIYLYKNKNQ